MRFLNSLLLPLSCNGLMKVVNKKRIFGRKGMILMMQLIIAIIGIVILIPILLVLPSVFTKLATFIHIITSFLYFLLGMFLMEHMHWSIVVGVVLLLLILTSFLFSQRLESFKLNEQDSDLEC